MQPVDFIQQLAFLMASDGKVEVSKRGTVFILKSAKNKVTIPQQLVPRLHEAGISLRMLEGAGPPASDLNILPIGNRQPQSSTLKHDDIPLVQF